MRRGCSAGRSCRAALLGERQLPQPGIVEPVPVVGAGERAVVEHRPLGKLSANEDTRDVLRPFGVFAVISPFNFPMALAAGMSGASLLAGNAVILKPSEDAPWCGQLLFR